MCCCFSLTADKTVGPRGVGLDERGPYGGPPGQGAVLVMAMRELVANNEVVIWRYLSACTAPWYVPRLSGNLAMSLCACVWADNDKPRGRPRAGPSVSGSDTVLRMCFSVLTPSTVILRFCSVIVLARQEGLETNGQSAFSVFSLQRNATSTQHQRAGTLLGSSR